MKRKLVIALSEEATEKYLEWAEKWAEAEVNADCEPCGVAIKVEIGPHIYGSYVSSAMGTEKLNFGEAEVNLVEF
ncbi:MAG: hypothetical protein QM504_06395 [Pseudomonadota bacterium]